jgi:hypothetical protein
MDIKVDYHGKPNCNFFLKESPNKQRKKQTNKRQEGEIKKKKDD